MKPNMLFVGLGGGLDIINASTLYCMAKEQGITARLGAIKSRDISHIQNITQFAQSGALVSPYSTFQNIGNGRYCEAAVAKYLDEEVFYFAQSNGTNALHDAIVRAKELYSFTHMVFVDCGGDSLLFHNTDANTFSEETDPFRGGDAISIAALQGIPDTYLGVCGVGLDIDVLRAEANLKQLAQLGQSYGALHLQTGKTSVPLYTPEIQKKESMQYHIEQYQEYTFPLKHADINSYFGLAEAIVDLGFNNEQSSPKFKSLTAPVLYHALKGNFGRHNCHMPWGQGLTGSIYVIDDYAWMHFCKADSLHKIKCEVQHD
jgi:hypothetical protein